MHMFDEKDKGNLPYSRFNKYKNCSMCNLWIGAQIRKSVANGVSKRHMEM